MKGFLFDENLPAKLLFVPSLPLHFVSALGASPSDTTIWKEAEHREWVIVTKDADFSDRIIVKSPPPWVVHLRFGNMRKAQFHAVLAKLWPQIESLLKNHKLVNVYLDRVEGIG